MSSTEWQWLVWSVSKEVCISINILAFHPKYPIEVPKTKEKLQIALFFWKFLFWFHYWHVLSFCRVVTKISSCWVNTTSRQGIKQRGISFGSIFLLFCYKSSWGKIPGPQILMTAWFCYNMLSKMVEIIIIIKKDNLVLLSVLHSSRLGCIHVKGFCSL